MPRRRRQELSINHERWLVSYSDFITLLFAFFVVMYSISQVNESKYRVLSDTLQEAFHLADSELSPVDVEGLPRTINPIQAGEISRDSDPEVIDSRGKGSGEQSGDGAFTRRADLPQLSEQVQQALKELVDQDLVQVNSNEFWLQIDLKSSILFASGGAEPTPEAKRIFSDLARLFKDMSNPIQVEGFTDNSPINTARYPSNWELSAARAVSVVKLLAQGGVAPSQLAAVGYGEYRPIARNDSPEGRAQNRRVSLMIAREKIERPRAFADESLPTLTRGGEYIEQSNLEPIVSEGNGQVKSTAAQPLPKPPSGESQRAPANPDDRVQPVKLEDGGLLFSSDPDLPRKP